MARVTHLNSLQALETAIRKGSLQGAAKQLGITPAAVGQRIRALESFLETDLLLRGRSGLQPTPVLRRALDDLTDAFDALGRVADTLDLQRTAEIHIVADADLSELWLARRLDAFRTEMPNVHFNLNGLGDVPMRLGAPDIVIDRNPKGRAADGEVLFHEIFAPVASPENAARIADPDLVIGPGTRPRYLPVGGADVWRHSVKGSVEGFPLLHTQPRPEQPGTPNLAEWFETFGYQRTAPERGVRYTHIRDALDGARSDAGLVITGLSYILDDLAHDRLRLPFLPHQCLTSEHPYRMAVRQGALARPQVARFRDWLSAEAADLARRMAAVVAA